MRCPDCYLSGDEEGTGNGECQTCGGTGISNSLFDKIADVLTDDETECVICDGSGVCQTCDGDGVVTDDTDEDENDGNDDDADAECAECGSSVPDDASFCPYCGVKFVDEDDE